MKKIKLTVTTALRPFFELSRVQLVILTIIIVIGSAFRFGGIGWGLPFLLHADEWAITDDAFKIAAGQITQPVILARPDHTNIKLNALVFKLVDSGIAGTIEENFISNITQYYTASRSVNAFMGVISILVAFMIGSLFNKKGGLFAAGLFALSPTFIMHSHYITPEILQTLCMLLSTYMMLIYLDNRKLPTAALACIAAALAFCEKYPAGYAVLFIAIGVYMAHPAKGKDTLLSKHVVKRWFQTAIIFIAAVFVISPTLILGWDKVIASAVGENRSGHLGADGLNFFGNIIYYFQTYLSHFGIVVSTLTAFGLWKGFKQDKAKTILIATGIGYIVPLAVTNLHWERWGVPFYAYMLILAAIGASYALDFIKVKTLAFTGKKRLCLNLATMAIIFVLPVCSLLLDSISTTASFVVEDTRVATQALVQELDMNSENTYYEGYTPLRPTYPATIFDKFENLDFSKPNNPDIKYVILSSSMYNRFYDESEQYAFAVMFYDSIMYSDTLIKIVAPVEDYESAIEFINIRNSIKEIIAYFNGGYRGPTLIFAEIPNGS